MAIAKKATIIVTACFVLVVFFQNCGKSSDSNSAPTTTTQPSKDSSGGTDFKKIFSESDLPCEPKGDFAEHLKDYLYMQPPKAIAISKSCHIAISRSKGWFNYYVERLIDKSRWVGINNQPDANRMALESCQFISNNEECTIFAEGNEQKYEVSKHNEQTFVKVLNLEKPFDIYKLPFVSTDVSNYLATEFKTKQFIHKYIAVALHPAGIATVSYSNSMTTAKFLALSKCIAATKGKNCFLYAESSLDINGNRQSTVVLNANAPESYDSSILSYHAGDSAFVKASALFNGYSSAVNRYSTIGSNIVPVLAFGAGVPDGVVNLFDTDEAKAIEDVLFRCNEQSKNLGFPYHPCFIGVVRNVKVYKPTDILAANVADCTDSVFQGNWQNAASSETLSLNTNCSVKLTDCNNIMSFAHFRPYPSTNVTIRDRELTLDVITEDNKPSCPKRDNFCKVTLSLNKASLELSCTTNSGLVKKIFTKTVN